MIKDVKKLNKEKVNAIRAKDNAEKVIAQTVKNKESWGKILNKVKSKFTHTKTTLVDVK